MNRCVLNTIVANAVSVLPRTLPMLVFIEADAPTDVDVGAMDVKQDAAESKEPSKGT